MGCFDIYLHDTSFWFTSNWARLHQSTDWSNADSFMHSVWSHYWRAACPSAWHANTCHTRQQHWPSHGDRTDTIANTFQTWKQNRSGRSARGLSLGLGKIYIRAIASSKLADTIHINYQSTRIALGTSWNIYCNQGYTRYDTRSRYEKHR